MAYPQAQASQEVLEGQNFFNLFTELVSSGDVYEMDASAQAFCIGPQSDIARARVTYYDPSVAARSSSFVISVDSPFIGRIDRLGSQRYPVAGVPANILISPEDVIGTNYIPPGAAPGTNVISFVKPNIDVIGYFAAPPETPSRRADFTRKGSIYVVDDGSGTDGTTYLIYPYYRRKYASINISNDVASPYVLTVDGISFTSISSVDAINVPIIAAGVIAASSDAPFEIRASSDGLHDYLVIGIAGPIIAAGAANAIYVDVTFTDEVN